MIKLKKKIEISDGFMAAVRGLSSFRLKAISELNSDVKNYIKTNRAIDIAALVKQAKGDFSDIWMTELRSLPYTSLDVYRRKGIDYILAATKEVTIENWSMGEYRIFIPFTDFHNGNLAGTHYIPVRDMKAYYRHPHHKSYVGEEGEHPLDRRVWSCYGGFNNFIFDMVEYVQIIELFRNLYAYLSRYDKHSPITKIEYIEFKTEKDKK